MRWWLGCWVVTACRWWCDRNNSPPVRPPQWDHEGGYTGALDSVSANKLSTPFMWRIWRLKG
ncbi:hypothetical protein ECANGB1_2748 [Enterospora canceri]|uniref:Secreted protein n=1 Tax=Enterospora canceri TaxID=1081671 RepID=A0A1Y1S3S9_9MICR|nr:hypothetical protein ECANGB1_2748 [Enterospora canceri]